MNTGYESRLLRHVYLTDGKDHLLFLRFLLTLHSTEK